MAKDMARKPNPWWYNAAKVFIIVGGIVLFLTRHDDVGAVGAAMAVFTFAIHLMESKTT